MKIIIISRNGTRRRLLNFDTISHLFLPVLVVCFLCVMGTLLIFPQLISDVTVNNREWPAFTVAAEKQLLRPHSLSDSSALSAVSPTEPISPSAQPQTNMAALILRLGAMEAEMVRLNGIASRVIKRAHLDPKEFALDQKITQPSGALGAEGSGSTAFSYVQLINRMGRVKQQQDQHTHVFSGLYHLLTHQVLERERLPSVKPLKTGRISSYFGHRRDPFTRMRRFHRGIDFAARMGTPIYSVGAGKVIFVGRKGGYGLVVELDHGKNLISRYAHLRKALVAQGQIIRKSQKIAQLGNSGRSTGPHLHLEILRNGKQVNPMIYLKAR